MIAADELLGRSSRILPMLPDLSSIMSMKARARWFYACMVSRLGAISIAI